LIASRDLVDGSRVSDAWQALIGKTHQELSALVDGDPPITMVELGAAMGAPEDVPEAVIAARAQKALLGLLKSRLEATPSLARVFVAPPSWPWLAKLLAIVRIKELAAARVVLRGKRGYDVTELAATHHGKRLLDGLGFGRRRMLDKSELAQLEQACNEVKLTLPRVIEPTTTERFFASDTSSSNTED
jgi:hypothetical protein